MSGATPRLFWAREPRWYPMVTVAPYVLLVLLAGYTVAAEWGDSRAVVIDLVLCGVLAAWMVWMFTLHPDWRERPGVMVVFVAGVLVLMAVLILRAPWFGFFCIAGYAYTFAVLPWPWRLAGAAGVAVLAGTSQMHGVPKSTAFELTTYVLVVAINVIAICVAAWIFWNSDEHNKQRKLALAELGEANRRLEASLAENAELHDRLVAQAREAGMLDERQRMAREIHDTLAQGLTGIITQLQAAEHAADQPAGWRRHVEAATGLARESLSEARRSVHALRPEALEVARLGEALATVAERWSALQGVPVQVTTTGTPRPLSAEAEAALLRTAQEALANVAKHAGADRVGVTLSYLDEQVALDIRDNGRGFAPGAGGGFGLVGMRERAEALAGSLQIESEPGGTAISVSLPTGGNS
ncbi:sensor histidine kinase [Kribbella lupini]|uniref:Oxygen sensor histidine kinase NreB n=1 Tax=Kribbella lupini TaxID=291602 RepID=A0ABP4KYE0_9ACTN